MEKPTVIDYFSGPGGLSEGFKQAGFNILLGIDSDENSAQTFKKNNQNSAYLKTDISNLNPDTVAENIPINPEDVDIFIGGPPCQGFSIAGERENDDDRNKLFKDYARHIEKLKPKFILMENVPGMLSMETPEGRPVIQEIQDRFNSIGYKTEYKKLLSSNYGVPQNRERVIILGTRLDNGELKFPERTHIGDEDNFKLNEIGRKKLKQKVTVAEAISDLPKLKPGQKKNDYKQEPQNDYQRTMRKNITSNSVYNHNAVNHRDHIVKRFSHIPQGGDMTDAPEKHQPSKIYSSRNRRLVENKPSYTITSHVLDELIHPWENRSITVRESARLQSFPDHYEFIGERNVFHGSEETSQYEQVGNAVPVIMAKKIAEEIKNRNFNN